MWYEVRPAIEVHPILALLQRGSAVQGKAVGTVALVVAEGFVGRAVRVLAAVDVLAGDSQEEQREEEHSLKHGAEGAEGLGGRGLLTLGLIHQVTLDLSLIRNVK